MSFICMVHFFALPFINQEQDDSAIRRISLPEMYLSADACLILLSMPYFEPNVLRIS